MDLNFIDRQVSRLSKFLETLALISFVILTTSVIFEVVARSIFNRPTIWSLEIVTYTISCVAFFGSAYVLRINRHLEINLFKQKVLVDFVEKYFLKELKIFKDCIIIPLSNDVSSIIENLDKKYNLKLNFFLKFPIFLIKFQII